MYSLLNARHKAILYCINYLGLMFVDVQKKFFIKTTINNQRLAKAMYRMYRNNFRIISKPIQTNAGSFKNSGIQGICKLSANYIVIYILLLKMVRTLFLITSVH